MANRTCVELNPDLSTLNSIYLTECYISIWLYTEDTYFCSYFAVTSVNFSSFLWINKFIFGKHGGEEEVLRLFATFMGINRED